jgi:tetratricopeptide (TPR) repeat protein
MVIAVLMLSSALAAGPQEAPPPMEEPIGAEPALEPTPSEESAIAEPLPTEESPAVADPMAAQAAIEVGLRAFRRRHYSEAIMAFERALEADPQSAAAAYYLGYAHYKKAEPTLRKTADKERAAELFAMAFTLDPEFKPAWWGRPAEPAETEETTEPEAADDLPEE